VLRCRSLRLPYEFYINTRFYIDAVTTIPILFDLKQRSVPSTPASRLLSLKETAAYLHISERSVQTLRSRRLLPAIKLSNRCLRFRLSDIDRALAKLTEKELS
jgi:predicted DNA-binding transcriptional regulator AlpA